MDFGVLGSAATSQFNHPCFASEAVARMAVSSCRHEVTERLAPRIGTDRAVERLLGTRLLAVRRLRRRCAWLDPRPVSVLHRCRREGHELGFWIAR